MSRVITARQALDQGISADSLDSVAEWNEKIAEKSKFPQEKERLRKQAAELREVSLTLSANNLE